MPGITGAVVDFYALTSTIPDAEGQRHPTNPSEVFRRTYGSTEECIRTNYYGAKRMADLLIPLLQLSDSPRIVNVSSTAGKLGERVDEVVHEFLKDFKEGSLETKGWLPHMSAYVVSKTALNAYTRILAKRYPSFCINCVCPGFVKTDMNDNTGVLSLEEGAANLVRLALLPNGGPSGLFFVQQEVSPF